VAGGPISISRLISLTLACVAVGGCSVEPEWGCCYVAEKYETDIDVSDWVVTVPRYVNMRAAIDEYGPPWRELDDEQRCERACAYASDNLSVFLYAYEFYESELRLDDCMLTIPNRVDGPGLLSCSGVRVDYEHSIPGRRPLAWTQGGLEIADPLSWMATIEQVSIAAFEQLAAQLRHIGAPIELIDRCRAAARDEARHVSLIESLGGRTFAHEGVSASLEAPLFDIALHNAVEGCVTETWSALLARRQSEHAADATTRRVFAEIAEDECRHAQLAWDLHDWLCSRLEPEQVEQVEAARLAALADLERSAMQHALTLPDEARHTLGLPDVGHARALAREFGRRLAAAA
jgi:hypothetical protein